MRHLRWFRRPKQFLIELFHPRFLLGGDCFQVMPLRGFDAGVPELALGRCLVSQVGRTGAAQAPEIDPADTRGLRQHRQIALDVVVRPYWSTPTARREQPAFGRDAFVANPRS